MNNYDNKIGQNQDCPRKKTLDVFIPKPFPINQPRLSTPSATSGTGVGSMQEMVRDSLFLALMELPTEFQEAHLKKSTSALSKCLDKGVAGIQRRFSMVEGNRGSPPETEALRMGLRSAVG